MYDAVLQIYHMLSTEQPEKVFPVCTYIHVIWVKITGHKKKHLIHDNGDDDDDKGFLMHPFQVTPAHQHSGWR